MKKSRIKQFNVGTSKYDLLAKPYGFCCDIKDHDPTLRIKKGDSGPLFSDTITGEGPDIKFRIQDPGAPSTSSRSAQNDGKRTVYRDNLQNGRRRGYRKGYIPQSQLVDQNGQSRRQRGGYDHGYRSNSDRRAVTGESLDGPMICKRCKGPLRWYLEDEIEAARDIMINRRQKEYNAEIEKNVKIAIQKEKRRKRKKVKIND